MQSDRISCPMIVTLEFSRQFFDNCSNFKFIENPLSGIRVGPCWETEGQTDMTKQIFAFRDSAKAPKSVVGNRSWLVAVRETTLLNTKVNSYCVTLCTNRHTVFWYPW